MEVVNQTIMMTLLIIVGVICFKTKIINSDSLKSISSLTLKVAVPCVIINSFQRDFEPTQAQRLLYSLILSVAAVAVSVIFSYLFVRGKNKDKLAIERFSAMYSNCAFMGIPLINGIYGADGVFYLTTFYALFNVLVWSHGIVMMKGEHNAKSVLNVFKSPAFLSVIVGTAFFLLKIRLPDVVNTAVGYLGDLSTPLGMIVAGGTIAQTNILKAFKKGKIYWICALRLIIIPLVSILIFLLFPYDEMLMGVAIIANACPTATICTMFSIAYGKDSLYASEIFAFSTLLSMGTLPLIFLIFTQINLFVR